MIGELLWASKSGRKQFIKTILHGFMNPFASVFFLVENGSQFQAKARLEAALRCADGCKVGC